MRVNCETVKTFLFDQLNNNYSTLKKIASVIANFARTILSAGLDLPVFLYNRFSKEQKVPSTDTGNSGVKPASLDNPRKIHVPEGSTVLIIENHVYDVTNFLSSHPGGTAIIQQYAGQDATRAFNDTGHSHVARKEMEKYRICTLSEWNAQHAGK